MMTIAKQHIACFCGVLIIYGFGIGLFTRGFLLKRDVVPQSSSCDPRLNEQPHSLHTLTATTGETTPKLGCWLPKRFNKAVLIVIDALRFDFVAHNASINRPYSNKLKYIHQLLQEKSQHSRLYHFWADPPTTTMQRLKGLTTGSLPTFVDAGSNFDSSEIMEDNFIDQLSQQLKSMIFMGDDTWNNLFPNRFAKNYHYPSFNVKDLHTVDNGVLEHLMPEIRDKNWDILIAHFLGVDHCGHRYGPDHNAMAEKLTQMDNMIRTLVQELDNDTVLFLFGDHGMTRTGDHGGDSLNELDAALFVYSPSMLSYNPQSTFADVAQVDLVPTISLLLGSPIPFSNLGAVITDLFNRLPKADDSTASLLYKTQALASNAAQVRRYLAAYRESSDEFPYIRFNDLQQLYGRALREFELVTMSDREDKSLQQKLEKLMVKFTCYLQDSREMCREIWAKFDLSAIVLGIATVTLMLCVSVYLIQCDRMQSLSVTTHAVLGATVCITAYIVFIYYLHLSMASLITVLVFGIIIITIITALIANTLTSITAQNQTKNGSMWIFCVLCLSAYAVMFFSNSFVVYEDTVVCFLLQSWICVQIWSSLRENKSKDSYTVITAGVCLAIAIRLATNLHACREEQWTCEPATLTQPMTMFTDTTTNTSYVHSRLALSGCSLLFTVLATRWWLRRNGNINGSSPTVLCAVYAIPMMAICVGLYWTSQAIPQHRLSTITEQQMNILPRAVYVLFAIVIVCVIFKPLTLYVKPLSSTHVERSVPGVYHYMKMNWRQNSHDEPHALVYGLATVYSSCHLVVVCAVAVLLSLVLRDGVAASITLQLTAMFCVLEMQAKRSKDQHTDVPWSEVYCWGLLASHHFFTTGHQMALPTIQWEAAFTGFSDDFDVFVVPFTLVYLNTFASHVLSTVALPLLVYWPYTRGRNRVLETRETRADASGGRGEFILYDQPRRLRSAVIKLMLGSLTFYIVKLLSVMCAAALHRRHLMVWKIFAPRFVFEVATFAIVGPLLLVMYLFTLRIDTTLAKSMNEIYTK